MPPAQTGRSLAAQSIGLVRREHLIFEYWDQADLLAPERMISDIGDRLGKVLDDRAEHCAAQNFRECAFILQKSIGKPGAENAG